MGIILYEEFENFSTHEGKAVQVLMLTVIEGVLIYNLMFVIFLAMDREAC